MANSHTQDLQAFCKRILHQKTSYAKLNGLWRSEQPLHFCETSGQLLTERSFDIQKMTWLKIWNIYNIHVVIWVSFWWMSLFWASFWWLSLYWVTILLNVVSAIFNVILMNVILLNFVILSVILLNAIIQTVILTNVITLSVLAPGWVQMNVFNCLEVNLEEIIDKYIYIYLF